MLKSLEVSGFKSFAKKSYFEFNSPITAIVGPNGSGKSNIAEAFRFVLGEQSMKGLRSKRGEDLIWNGSAKLPRLNRASVKLVFDNRKRSLDIDFDEVIIERVVHRDSSNEYLINGSQVRLKDIIELLAKAHIGSSGHHIISQGEADSILSASPKERREMIEDALGLKIFQYKRLESLRKLEKTEENMAQVETLRKEISPHIKFLKKQVEKIEKTEEMRRDLGVLYLDYLKREDLYIKHEHSEVQSKRKGPEAELQHIDKAILAARELLDKEENDDKNIRHLAVTEEKLKMAAANKDSINLKLGKCQGQLEYYRKREKILEHEKEKQSLTLDKKDVEAFSRDVEGYIDEATKTENVSVIKMILGNAKKRIRDFFSKLDENLNSKELAQIKKEISTLEQEHREIEVNLKQIENETRDLEQQYSTKKSEIESRKDTLRETEKTLFHQIQKKNELRLILSELKSREDRLKQDEINFKREVQEGVALVGRDISNFFEHEPKSGDGKALSLGEILGEGRAAQEERRRLIEKLKIRLEDAGIGGFDDIMKEYKDVSERDAFLAREIADLETSKASLENLIQELEQKLVSEFKAGVEKINKEFTHFFSLMFGGGEATLEIVREKKKKEVSEDVLADIGVEDEQAPEEGEEGVEAHVSLPHKKNKGLLMLSGGERALTSIALLFAISQVNPPPFIILDETDAALDEANSKKYGDMIENLSKRSQLILITHNRETMSRAGVLYGITVGLESASKLLSISFDQALAVAK